MEMNKAKYHVVAKGRNSRESCCRLPAKTLQNSIKQCIDAAAMYTSKTFNMAIKLAQQELHQGYTFITTAITAKNLLVNALFQQTSS